MHDILQTILVPGLAQGAIFGLIAVAFAVTFSVTGVVNFAHGQMVMLMPLGVLVATDGGVPVWLAYLLALVVMVVVGLAQEWVAVRPFAYRGHSSLAWILSTLGVSVVLAEVLAMPYDGESRAFPHGFGTASVDLLGLRVVPAELASLLVLFAVAAAVRLVFTRTQLGLRLRAIADDVDGAEALGISRARVSQIAMTIAVLVAAITGICVASNQLVGPSLGLAYTFYGFVAVALGGMTSIGGAVVGGLAVGVVSQAAGVYAGALFVNVTVFVLLLGVYLLRPHGLFGSAPVRQV